MLTTIDQNAFRPYLLADERLQWTGQPRQGLVFTRRDIGLVPFSLMFAGFALFWNYSVWMISDWGSEGRPGIFFRLWGLPFLLAGLYVVVGRFFHDVIVRRRLIYGVSN